MVPLFQTELWCSDLEEGVEDASESDCCVLAHKYMFWEVRELMLQIEEFAVFAMKVCWSLSLLEQTTLVFVQLPDCYQLFLSSEQQLQVVAQQLSGCYCCYFLTAVVVWQ